MVVLSGCEQATGTGHTVFQENGKAIRGYDVVAYFTDQKPVKGDPAYTYSWKGVDWQFSSAEHLERFTSNPEQYAPQYGGYCAYGLSEGHKSPTQPDAWTIRDNKLYLNYDLDVKELWSKDIPGRILRADSIWIVLKDQPE